MKVRGLLAILALSFSCSTNEIDLLDNKEEVFFTAFLPEEQETRLHYSENDGMFKVYWKGSTDDYQEYIKIVGITGDLTVASEFWYRSKKETEDSKTASFGSPVYSFWDQKAFYGYYIMNDGRTEWANLESQSGKLENLAGYHFMTGEINENDGTISFNHDICIFKLASLALEDNLSGQLSNIVFSSPQLSVFQSRYTYTGTNSYDAHLEFTNSIPFANDKTTTRITGVFSVINGKIQDDIYVVCFPTVMEEFSISAEIDGDVYCYTYGKPITTVRGKVYQLSNKVLRKQQQ